MGGESSRATMWVSQVNTTGRQPHAITAVFHQHPLLPGRSGVPATRACHSSIVSVDCSCTAIVGGGGQHSAWRHTKLPLVCGDAPVLGSRFKASRVNHLARCERRLGICAALLRARLTHIDKPPCPVMRLRGMYTRFISGGLLCGGGIPHRGTMRIPQLAPGREHHERRHSGATRGRFDQHAHTAPTPSFGGHCAAGRVSRQATCSRACSTSSGIDRAAKAAAVEASSPPYCAALAAQYASATWWPNFTGSEIFGAWARAHSWAAISDESDICHRLLSTPQHIPAHVGAQVFAAQTVLLNRSVSKREPIKRVLASTFCDQNVGKTKLYPFVPIGNLGKHPGSCCSRCRERFAVIGRKTKVKGFEIHSPIIYPRVIFCQHPWGNYLVVTSRHGRF